jgi:hypothetical protein
MVGIRFNIYSYALFASIITIIYFAYKLKTENILIDLDYYHNLTFERKEFIYLLPVIFSVFFIFIILMTGFKGFIVPPDNADTTQHVLFISQIFEQQTVSMFRTNFYPYGFHSFAALLMYLIPMPIYKIPFYALISLTAILPAALYFLVTTVYEDKKIAAFTAITSITIHMFPYLPYRWGSWGVIAGFIFVPIVVSVAYRAFKENDLKLTVLTGLLFGGLYYVHTSELLTTAIILTVLVLPLILKMNWRQFFKIVFPIAIIGIIFMGSTLPALVSYIVRSYDNIHFFDTVVTVPFALDRFIGLIFEQNNNYLALLLFLSGIVYCLYKRKYYEFLIIHLIFLAIYVDSSSTLMLKPLFNATYPWGSFDRLLYIQSFFVPFFCGVGLATIWSHISRIRSTRKAITLMLVVTLLLSIGYSVPVAITKNNLQMLTDSYAPVNHDDLRAIQWIENNVPQDAVILNDFRNDAGIWIPPLTNRKVLIPHLPFNYHGYLDRLYLLEHVHEVPDNENATKLMSRFNISYVFYGSKLVSNNRHILDLPGLENNPDFKLRYKSNQTRVFEYVPKENV